MEQHFRNVVEQSGGVFIRLKNNVVHFSSGPGEEVLSLYSFACTPANVKLTLKAHREELARDRWAALV